MNSVAKLFYVFAIMSVVTKVTTLRIPFEAKIGDAFIGAAAESTSLPPFICPGTGSYPVPGKECTGVFISCATGVPVEEPCSGASVFDPTLLVCTSASTAPCKSNSTVTTPSTTTSTISSSVTWRDSTVTSTESTVTWPQEVTSTESTVTWPQEVTSTELPTETSSISTKSTMDQSTTSVPMTTPSSNITRTLISTSTSSTPFVCTSANGNFANPSNCKSFFMCSNGVAYYFECPSNLVFNPTAGYCDYPANVPGCKEIFEN